MSYLSRYRYYLDLRTLEVRNKPYSTVIFYQFVLNQPCPVFASRPRDRDPYSSERWPLGAYSATRSQPFSGVKGGSGQNKGVYTFIYIDRNCLNAFLVLQEHCGGSLARPRCPGLPDPTVRHSEVMEQPLYLKICNGSPKTGSVEVLYTEYIICFCPKGRSIQNFVRSAALLK